MRTPLVFAIFCLVGVPPSFARPSNNPSRSPERSGRSNQPGLVPEQPPQNIADSMPIHGGVLPPINPENLGSDKTGLDPRLPGIKPPHVPSAFDKEQLRPTLPPIDPKSQTSHLPPFHAQFSRRPHRAPPKSGR
ncbi:hypothetical protein F5148DRAFT_1222019 [Russula earlei]|uniref:Uncharacterized protein n=1 Tax=Russula earlei TaxID=71964 RepID=A0ACC0U1U9_9AGAM|nr:hypothetical protein F5148DRAFT_1222019 [Russula earlei]